MNVPVGVQMFRTRVQFSSVRVMRTRLEKVLGTARVQSARGAGGFFLHAAAAARRMRVDSGTESVGLPADIDHTRLISCSPAHAPRSIDPRNVYA